jgi:hypothetical protein
LQQSKSKEVDEMRAHMQRLQRANRFLLMPSGQKRQAWDCIVLVAMMYTAMWVPFEISTKPLGVMRYTAMSTEWLVVMTFDRLFDLIFLLDIFFNCYTGCGVTQGS